MHALIIETYNDVASPQEDPDVWEDDSAAIEQGSSSKGRTRLRPEDILPEVQEVAKKGAQGDSA